MPDDLFRDVMGPVFTCVQFVLLGMIVYEAACLALGAVAPIRGLLGWLWRRSHFEKPRPRCPRLNNNERPLPRAGSIESQPSHRRSQAGNAGRDARVWFDLRHTLRKPDHDTRPR
ncbi:MAG: hypothetical protein IT432_04140 [Phycisphaerales bacterium]|nr:hypothetical protein [Phycisphaerales bacterium]